MARRAPLAPFLLALALAGCVAPAPPPPAVPGLDAATARALARQGVRLEGVERVTPNQRIAIRRILSDDQDGQVRGRVEAVLRR